MNLVGLAWIHITRSRSDWLTRASSQWLTGEPHYITALRHHPYPTAPLDTAIFEPIPMDASAHPEVGRSVQMLRKLVKARDFHTADRVRLELLEVGETIPPHPIYENAAINVLKTSTDDHAQLEAFENWFSLIPDASFHRKVTYSFPKIRNLFFAELKVPGIPLIMRFALMAASKGYTRRIIVRETVDFVVRFSDPVISTPFLSQLMRVHDRGAQTLCLSTAIKAHCLAGRLPQAVFWFKFGLDQNMLPYPFTYRVLHHHLVQSQDADTLKLLKSHGASPWVRPIHNEPLAPVTTPVLGNPAITTASLPAQLRFISRTLSTANPPSPRIIASFIIAYKALGRSRAVDLLSRKVLSRRSIGLDKPLISLFLLAEMLYYLRTREYHLLLYVFAMHFYLVGVPIAHITPHLDALQHEKATDGAARARIAQHSLARIELARRLVPTALHTALVWTALVHLASARRAALEGLYAALLHEARRTPPHAGLVRPPAHALDSVHFTPFIRALAHGGDAARALDVFRDMRALDPPLDVDVYQWTAFLAEVAAAGRVGIVTRVLDRMEGAGGGGGGGGGAAGREIPMPPPNGVTYAAIIDGFVKSKQVRAAADVKSRMSARLGDVRGANPLADEVLDAFEDAYKAWKRVRFRVTLFLLLVLKIFFFRVAFILVGRFGTMHQRENSPHVFRYGTSREAPAFSAHSLLHLTSRS
jgi:pentatricopeptide repeat protein